MDTEPRIRSETALVAGKTRKLAKKLSKKESELSGLGKQINTLTSGLSADFQSKNTNYDNLVKNVDDLTDKLNKSKLSAEQSEISGQINGLVSKRKSLANDLKKLGGSSYGKITRLKRQHRNLVKLIRDTRTRYKESLVKEQNLHKELTKANHAIMQKYNAPKIARQLKGSDSYTTLYRADMGDPTVFKLVETSPTETDSNDVSSKPIDGSQEETNFIAQSDREYSSTFYLQGKDFKDLDSQFRKLYEWSFRYEFVVDGFSHWSHALITSLEKSTASETAGNSMILTITFTYARQAQIKYMRKRKAVHHKAPAKKHKRVSSKSRSHFIKVKSGMTYAQIARKTGVPLATIMKMNHWKATSLPVGAKVRYR